MTKCNAKCEQCTSSYDIIENHDHGKIVTFMIKVFQ